MNEQERKALTEKAYGKPITFTPRHWTLYEWVSEQAGTSLRDKLYGVVKAAYNADYGKRGRDAMGRYWEIADAGGDLKAMFHELSDAIECFNRAGMEHDAQKARRHLYEIAYQKEQQALR